jgi:CRP-like cAMP-binding protein
MSHNESAPPPGAGGGGTEAEEAAWEIATAEGLRARGELAQAATWYRRAANHLMEAGDDERAISFAKLAAELAALDDAVRPGRAATGETPPPVPARMEQPVRPAPRRGEPARPPSPPSVPKHEKLPWLASAPSSPASAPRPAVPPAACREALPSIAEMVDEAVSHLDELPPAPLVADAGPRERQSSYLPERIAETDRITARLPVLPLFAELPAYRVRAVARQVGIARYRAGELLCEAGAPEGPMFVIMEGAAHVVLAGQDAPVAVVTAGDFVGEVAALYGGPRTASVVARDEVEALAFAPSLLRALTREFPSFREAIEEVARERMRESLPRLSPLLRRMDDATREGVYRLFELVALPEGTLLLTEGEPADALHLIAAGEVELYGGPFGVTRTHHARAGEALGVTAVLTGDPAGVSARAAREVLVARLPRARVREALAAFPALADAIDDVAVPGRGVVC